MLNRLKISNRFAKRMALLGIFQRRGERRFAQTERHRADADSPTVQHLHRVAEPRAAVTQKVLVRDATIFKKYLGCQRGVQTHLALEFAKHETGRSVRDND